MFHPFIIIPFSEIIPGMSPSTFFPRLSRVHQLLRLNKQILQFKSLNQISIPTKSPISYSYFL